MEKPSKHLYKGCLSSPIPIVLFINLLYIGMKHFYNFFNLPKGVATLLVLMLGYLGANAQLSGSYTINPSASASATNYQSFTAAVNDMSAGTRTDGGTPNGPAISSSVTFNVSDGTYNEQLQISSITGTSATKRITFQSLSGDSSKVILQQPSQTSSTNNYLVYLNNGDYIGFKKMTLQRTGTNAYAVVVYMAGGSCNNKFENCVIRTVYNATQAYPVYNYYNTTGTAQPDSGNLFQNNVIKNGYYAVYNYGYNSVGSGYEANNRFIGNTIDSFIYIGIYGYYQDAPQYINNKITCSPGGYYYAYGLYDYYGINGGKIQKNKIWMRAGGYGLYMYNHNGSSSKRTTVSNNFITVENGTYYSFPIYHYYSTYTNIYNNSFLSHGSSAYYYYAAGGYFYNYTASNSNVGNNIFANDNGGIALYLYDPTYYNTFDYNDYYATGTNLTCGTTSSTYYTSLSAWKTAISKEAQCEEHQPELYRWYYKRSAH